MKVAIRFIVLLMGLGTTALGVSEFRAAFSSTKWPVTPGVITAATAGAQRCITFTYSVAGQSHTSNTTFFHEENVQSDKGPSCQNDVLERYRPGTGVSVYYDPNHPDYGVLRPGPNTATYLVLGVGLLFTMVGAVLVWQWIATVVRVRRIAKPLAAPAANEAFSAGTGAVAPSEVVAIFGDRFASATLGGNIRLLDGTTEVSCRELVEAELMAALLSLEEAGAIRFEIESVDSASPELFVVRTESRVEWTAPCTETRLDFRGKEPLRVVVRRWMACESHWAWQRAAEKTYIPMVLRGAVVLDQKGSERRYLLINRSLEAAAAQALPAVSSLLYRCRTERPKLWHLVKSEVAEAAAVSPQTGATADTIDPWYDEAATDLKRVPGLKLRGQSGTSWLHVGLLAILFWGIAAWVFAEASHGARIAMAASLPFAFALSELARRTRAVWIPLTGTRRESLERTLGNATAADWGKLTFVFAPVVTLIPLLAVAQENRTAVAAAAVLGAVSAGTWLLRKKAGQAITAKVTGTPRSAVRRSAVLARVAAAGAGSSSPAALPDSPPVSAAPVALPFNLELIKPPELPPVSQEASARLAAIRERGPRVRRLYRNHLLFLVGSLLLIRAFVWIVLDAQHSFPWFSLILLVGTFFAVFAAQISRAQTSGEGTSGSSLFFVLARLSLYVWRYLQGGEAQQRNRWQRDIQPIRPLAAPLLGLIWSVYGVLFALWCLSIANAWKWLAAIAALAAMAGWRIWLRKLRRNLETACPVYPALNLLTLRVFGSPSRDLFVQLLDMWHWFGQLYRLDGPDTAGGKSSDLLAYVTGRLDAAVVANPVELTGALKKFARARDSQLRFAFNSMQCTDAVWKSALQAMLDQADVVVMDLSGLSEANRGCAYEIAKLVNEVPFDRFILLVDDGTDIPFLRTLLSEAASSDAPVQQTQRTLRLFHLGTLPKRNENESVYEWQRRTTSPIDADRLIGLLCDAALKKRGAQVPLTVPWTRPAYRGAPVVAG